MRKITTKEGKHTVLIFDHPKQLGIRRFQKYNKHEMIALQVGETIEDYNNRHGKAIRYIEIDDKKSALIEMTNQQQCVYNAIEEYSPSNMALASLVYSIDGKLYPNYDDDSLLEITVHLEEVGFTKEMVYQHLEEVKKK